MNRPGSAAELLEAARLRLSACGVDGARLDTEVLLAHAMGIDRGRLVLLLAGGRGLPPGGPIVEAQAASRFRAMVERRGSREPLAYITGLREFWSLELEVTLAVLIPRPETEILVQEALAAIPAGERTVVVDVGTGSGAVALALAKERPSVFVVATDISETALEVARRNVARHDAGTRVRLARCDLLSALLPRGARDGGEQRGRRYFIVSNPPYVDLDERETLMPEVRDHEPAQALYAGVRGMEIIERLVPQAEALLAPGEWLMMEVAAPRAPEVTALLEGSRCWDEVGVREDYAGLPRVVRARRSSAPSNEAEKR